MTLCDPIIETLASHLKALATDASIEPKDVLSDDVSFLVKSKSANVDSFLLGLLGKPILDIVYSENTTAAQKKYAIKVLDWLLPLYSYENVVGVFGIEPICDAITVGKQHDLQKAIVDLLLRVNNPDESLSGPIVNSLFKAFSDIDLYYGVADHIHEVILHLAHQSHQFREMLLENQNIQLYLHSMMSDGLLKSRLSDLIIDLLPEVPNMNEEFYLTPERDLLSINDPLLFAFIIKLYLRLLQVQNKSGKLSFLETDMNEQFNYCAKLFVDPSYAENIKDEVSCVFPEVLGQLSITFPKKFHEINCEYNLVDFSVEHIKSNVANRFLSFVNPMALYKNNKFFENFHLNSETVEIFYNLASNETVFNNNLDANHFPLQKINLAFPNLLWIFDQLTQFPHFLKRLTQDWKPILELILKPKNTIADPNLAEMRKNIMEAIQNSNLDLSEDLKKTLEQELILARKGVYVLGPATATF